MAMYTRSAASPKGQNSPSSASSDACFAIAWAAVTAAMRFGDAFLGERGGDVGLRPSAGTQPARADGV